MSDPITDKKELTERNLLASSIIVSSMTMLSRVMGLIRDVIFARFLGAAAEADVFFLAFKIPNFFRRLFAEGAFSQAFVPVLTEYREAGSIEAVKHFTDRVAGCLGISLIGLCSLVVIAAPLFTALFGMGYLFTSPEKYALTTDLLRITFPYLMLISIAGFASAVLNSYGQFAVPAFTPVILNIVLILAAVFVSPHFDEPVMALGWGVLVAGGLQFTFQLPFLARLGLLPHPKVDWSDESIKKVLRLMAPALFGVSVSQINLLFDSIIATFLPTGSVSWLYFSDRLTELPLGVFGVGIATVILPKLSSQFVRGASEFSQTLDWALKMILIFGLPASLALFVLAEPILFTLFQYGKTTSNDILMSSYSLKAYAAGLLAFMLIKVLVSGYFSRQDTKTPVRYGIIAMVSNMGLNVIFVLPFHFLWSIGHVGLALATACSAFLNAGLLFVGLKKDGIYLPGRGWQQFAMTLAIANVCMVLVLYIVLGVVTPLSHIDTLGRCLNLTMICIAGGATYFSTLFLAGFRASHLRPSA